MALPEITIIRDTREQKGWIFDPEEKKPGKIRILGTEIGTLPAGDYSIKDHEDLIVIERKSSFCELFGNMIPSSNKDRFHREMEKLSCVKYKYMLIESSPTKDILGMSIPQFYKSPPTSAVIRWLELLEMDYGIKIRYVNDCGEKYAKMLFEQAIRSTL